MKNDSKKTDFNKEIIKAMVKFEGFEIQEAKLIYVARQDFPASIFCGPNRTFPAQDTEEIQESLDRLALFGHRIDKGMRGKIVRSLTRKAKRFGMKHNPNEYKWNDDGTKNVRVEETAKSKIAWYLKEMGID